MTDFREKFNLLLDECSTISLRGDVSYAEVWLNTFFHDKWKLRTKQPLSRGSHQDFVVIDGKSDSPEEIRELIPSMSQYPSGIPLKIYYIKNFHLLHRNAWSAFLKVFEEPFPHVRFLVSTDRELPGTIESRSITIQLPVPSREEIAGILESNGIDEYRFRSDLCGRSLSIAEGMKVDIVRRFQKDWTSYFGGGAIKSRHLVGWLEDLRSEPETERACFNALAQVVFKKGNREDPLSKELVGILADWAFEGKEFLEPQRIRVSLRRCLGVTYTREKRRDANP